MVKNRKYQNRMTIMIVISFVLFILLFQPVNAIASLTSAVNGVLRSMITDIVTGSLSSKSIAILTTPPWRAPSEDGVPDFTAAWHVAVTVFNEVIRPIAYSLIGLCFTIKLVQNATHIDQATPAKVWFGPLCALFACMFVTYYSLDITEKLISFGTHLATAVNTAIGNAELGNMDNILSRFKDLNKDGNLKISTAFGYIARLLLPWIACKLAGIVTEVVALVTMLEIVLRGMFMPMSAADMMLRGTSGGGFRYLRNYLAVVTQAAVIIAIGGIQGGLCAAILSGKTGSAFADFFVDVASLILFQIVGVGLMLKASSLSREIVGAN